MSNVDTSKDISIKQYLFLSIYLLKDGYNLDNDMIVILIFKVCFKWKNTHTKKWIKVNIKIICIKIGIIIEKNNNKISDYRKTQLYRLLLNH
ncbi:hypothetical protein P2W93_04920 [Clostridioides difficile]|nr:hypothetical protein [Clostridioides difficile]HBH3596392.1 hypothetical protein [Clostridioides difficile]